MGRLLQSPAPASGAWQPPADDGLAQRRHRRDRRYGCGYDASLGQRCRVAHIPTAAAPATAVCSLICQKLGAAALPIKKPAPVVLAIGSTSSQKYCPSYACPVRPLAGTPLFSALAGACRI